MAQLNTTGLIPERVEEFSKMFNDRVRSFDEVVQHEDLKYTFIKDGSRSVSYHSMLMRYGVIVMLLIWICLIRGGKTDTFPQALVALLNANYF